VNTYLTSHTLLARALDEKDPKAWEVFVEHYQNYIFKLLLNLGIKENREDVAQDVMLILWKKLDTYDRERCKFRTWMASVIRLTAMNEYRKNEKLKALEQCDYIESIPDEKSYMAFAEEEWKSFIMHKALDNISKEFQGNAMEVFKMNLSGYSVNDISEKLGLTTSTVYTLKKRVKKRLMQEVYFLKKDME
jgi:RNA polymerase sigma factor (sigma-70 family)